MSKEALGCGLQNYVRDLSNSFVVQEWWAVKNSTAFWPFFKHTTFEFSKCESFAAKVLGGKSSGKQKFREAKNPGGKSSGRQKYREAKVSGGKSSGRQKYWEAKVPDGKSTGRQ